MKPTFITACVDYLDYLSITYFENKDFFDEYIVVTSTKDAETINFCKKNCITCVITEDFYHGGAQFDRGRALNRGFQEIKNKNWVVHADSDIIFPKDFGELKWEDMDKNCFYGSRRVFLHEYEEWENYKKNGLKGDERCPLGFGFGYFQLFNLNAEQIKNESLNSLYPSSPSARDSDWKFFHKWGANFNGNYESPNEFMKELPFKVIHLGNDGENHFGRVSKKFL